MTSALMGRFWKLEVEKGFLTVNRREEKQRIDRWLAQYTMDILANNEYLGQGEIVFLANRFNIGIAVWNQVNDKKGICGRADFMMTAMPENNPTAPIAHVVLVGKAHFEATDIPKSFRPEPPCE